MVRSTLRIFLATALLLALVPTADAQDWAGRGRAHGTVKDEAGNPIEGARVEVYLRTQGNGPEPVITNEKRSPACRLSSRSVTIRFCMPTPREFFTWSPIPVMPAPWCSGTEIGRSG